MIWLVGMVIVIIVVMIGMIFLTCSIGRLELIQRAAGGKKWLSRLLAFLILLVGFCLFSFLLSVVDAIVIFLHLLIFFLVFRLVFLIVGKITGKQEKMDWQVWLALLTTAVYLGVGYYQCVHVWKTEYTLESEKPVGGLRIALLSDAHIGTTFDGEGFGTHLDEIMREEPDLILIPGDFVDDSTTREDMLTACRALGKTNTKYGVWFAYGNHDKGYYNRREFSAEELAQALTENHVHILEDEIAVMDDLCIVGRRDASSAHRAELAALLETVDPEKYIIVLDHEPTDYEKEAATAADLVVSGHTHGGQLIPLGLVGELFAGNNRTYGYERRNGTDFLVTSGISNWALHFKTGTRSEYVIIDLIPSNER